MKYLFFDLEYATSKGGKAKICEFGFVITDENFKILDRGNFIINPNIMISEWDFRVVRKILTRSIKEYEKNPLFNEYYYDIVDIFRKCDFVFGHTLDGDAQAINDECQRYGLKSIDFHFYDVRKMYSDFVGNSKNVSVINILTALNIEVVGKEHDAETDAYHTMLILKALKDRMSLKIDEFLELVDDSYDENKNFIVSSHKFDTVNRIEGIINGEITRVSLREMKKILSIYISNIGDTNGIKHLENMRISISINFENTNRRDFFKLIKLIHLNGGTYEFIASKSNIFIKYDMVEMDGSIKKCNKLDYVKEAISQGADIKILELEEFLRLIGLTMEEFAKTPLDPIDLFYSNNDERTNDLSQVSTEQESGTIGNLFGNLLDGFFDD